MKKINYSKWIDEIAHKIVKLRLTISETKKSSNETDPTLALNAQAELDNLFEELRDGHEQRDVLAAVERIENGEDEKPNKRLKRIKNNRKGRGKFGPESASGGVGVYGLGRGLKLWR